MSQGDAGLASNCCNSSSRLNNGILVIIFVESPPIHSLLQFLAVRTEAGGFHGAHGAAHPLRSTRQLGVVRFALIGGANDASTSGTIKFIICKMGTILECQKHSPTAGFIDCHVWLIAGCNLLREHLEMVGLRKCVFLFYQLPIE